MMNNSNNSSRNSGISFSEKRVSAVGSPLNGLAITGPSYSLNELDFIQSEHAGLEDFKLVKLVGKGGFAKVYQARRNVDGKIFALKVMRKDVLKKLRQVCSY